MRNFYNKQGKPRLYYTQNYKAKGWWHCRLDDNFGVIGYGRARSMEAAYNAYIRNRKFRRNYTSHWKNRR